MKIRSMQQPTYFTRSATQPVKENVTRRKKRSRVDEGGTSTVKAPKFRRSNASTSDVASGAAVSGSGATTTVRSNFPVEPNIRAKQTQLFGNRTTRPRTKLPQPKLLGIKRPQRQTTLSDVSKKERPRIDEEMDTSCKENVVRDHPSFPAVVVTNVKNYQQKSTPVAQVKLNTEVQRLLSNVSNVSVSTAAETDIESEDPRLNLNSLIILAADRHLLSSRRTATSLRYDVASYGPDWVLHHRSREELFQPWQMALDGRIEKQRLAVIETYWESMKIRGTTPATIFIAINNFSRLLNGWDKAEFENPSSEKWALTVLVAYRLAFKTEERPEVLWEVNNFWNVFPIFSDWVIDRSELNVNKVEMEALRLLEDSMDIPLAPMFLALYVSAAGWPHPLIPEYHELGLYLLSLATFASAKDALLRRVVPSKLAAAALVLAVKIVNGDRGSGVGIVRHLSECKMSTPNRTARKKVKEDCICRYEFFPSRLQAYSGLTMEDLSPIIRGLSFLLRSRPPETAVLKTYFPVWGDNDWQ